VRAWCRSPRALRHHQTHRRVLLRPLRPRGQTADRLPALLQRLRARQDPRSQYAAAVPIFVSKALRHEPITVFGDGEQTRDFIYVKDIAAANAHFALGEHTGVYNVAYGGRITINDLARRIVRLTRSRSEIRHLPERAGDVKHSWLPWTGCGPPASSRPATSMAASRPPSSSSPPNCRARAEREPAGRRWPERT